MAYPLYVNRIISSGPSLSTALINAGSNLHLESAFFNLASVVATAAGAFSGSFALRDTNLSPISTFEVDGTSPGAAAFIVFNQFVTIPLNIVVNRGAGLNFFYTNNANLTQAFMNVCLYGSLVP